MPRKGSVQSQHQAIAHVKRVVAVASGKGGVGKSTVAVNLATALALRRLRVGILDLDVFGPSVPTLMGLSNAPQPHLTSTGALVPLMNHGMLTMSMGFLVHQPDAPIVWRGLMVQKAVQQLLFDVDWRVGAGAEQPGMGLDVLIVDMPPGTGDVPLTLAQLVKVDGAVIVSTPQDVALSDVRKGISMFRKVSVPITGLILNQSHFMCPSCHTSHPLFGSPASFRASAERLNIQVLGELALLPGVSRAGDAGVPYPLWLRSAGEGMEQKESGGKEYVETLNAVAEAVTRFFGEGIEIQ